MTLPPSVDQPRRAERWVREAIDAVSMAIHCLPRTGELQYELYTILDGLFIVRDQLNDRLDVEGNRQRAGRIAAARRRQ